MNQVLKVGSQGTEKKAVQRRCTLLDAKRIHFTKANFIFTATDE